MRVGIHQTGHDDGIPQIHAAVVREDDFQQVGVAHAQDSAVLHRHGGIAVDISGVVLSEYVVSSIKGNHGGRMGMELFTRRARRRCR